MEVLFGGVQESSYSFFQHPLSGHTIQEATEDGESLLSLACSAGYYELAEVLLRMRASVEDRGVKGACSCTLMDNSSGESTHVHCKC